MFKSNKEIEIVDFVKRSPIGVTSSEIARYFNISRITVTKYLAVIKEKALIDFKQLGMAKLWYAPAEISKEAILVDMIVDIAANLDENTASTAIRKAGIEAGKKIDKVYKQFYNTERLSLEQFSEVVMDVGKKLGAAFTIIEKGPEAVHFHNNKSILGEDAKKSPALGGILAGMLGTLAAKNFGYAKVVLSKSLARGDPYDDIIIFLKKTEESEKEAIEYSAA